MANFSQVDVNANGFVTVNPDFPGGIFPVTTNGLPMTDDFDLAVYIKGDKKPTAIYRAWLEIEYEDGAPTTPPPTTLPPSTLPPSTPPPSTPPPTPSCVAEDFFGECTTTSGCKSFYGAENAYDCDNAGGGLCLCGDGDVCGCVIDVPTLPPSCNVEDLLGECTTMSQCQQD